MSIRWRTTGELLCAAVTDEMEGDTYIDDRLQYQLAVISKCIIADVDHEINGLHHWIHHDRDDDKYYTIRALPDVQQQPKIKD